MVLLVAGILTAQAEAQSDSPPGNSQGGLAEAATAFDVPHGDDLPAGGEGRGGSDDLSDDLSWLEYELSDETIQAQKQLLREELDENRQRLWSRVIARCLEERKKYGLPDTLEDPESSYRLAHLSMRRACYGPLRGNPLTLQYLRQLAADPDIDLQYDSMVAGLYLADEPEPEDLRALLTVFQTAQPEDASLSSRARQMGRACRTLACDPSPEVAALVAEVHNQCRQYVAEGSSWQKGAAIEGLYRSGRRSEALEALAHELDVSEDERQLLRMLDAAARLFNLEDFDPDLLDQAFERARLAALDVLENASHGTGVLVRLSREAKLFRGAMGFFESAARVADLPFLVQCYRDPRASVLLGITGLQGLRLTLQGLRVQLDPAGRRALDDVFHEELYSAAERIFDLDEEPMNEEERRLFHLKRDIRYNACQYFLQLWEKHEDVRNRWLEDPDAPEFLALMMLSEEDQVEEDGDQEFYYAVREKHETRLLCARLLAKMQDQLDWNMVDPDLGTYFLTTAAEEMQADVEELLPAFEMFIEADTRWITLEIPIVRVPNDEWIKDQAFQGLQDLGFTVLVSLKYYELRQDYPFGWKNTK